MDQDITTPSIGLGPPLLGIAGVPDDDGVDEGGGVEAEEGGDAGREVAEGSGVGTAVAEAGDSVHLGREVGLAWCVDCKWEREGGGGG